MTTTSQAIDGPIGSAPRFARLVIPTIFIVTIFNYMDRSVLTILLEDIGRDFDLSDTQLGLLSSLPFALLYALVGLPFARVADTWNRKYLIALSVAGWSIATAACGLAAGFASLFVLRLCVGIGEGAGTPATHSVIADFVSSDKRSFAASTLMLAAALGGLAGYAGGGTLADLFGWRSAFVLIGLPGILVALAVLAFVPERRAVLRWPSAKEAFGRELGAVLKLQLANKSYRYLLGGFALVYFAQMGISTWLAVYLMRTFAMSASEVGVVMGLVSALSMGLGSILGGMLGNKLSASHLGWLLGLPALCTITMLPCMLVILLAFPGAVLYTALAVFSFLAGAMYGPLFAAQYALTSDANRATLIALTALFTNLLGYGLGPLAVGALSDWAMAAGIENPLRASLILASVLFVPSAALFGLGARTMVVQASD